VRHGRWCDINDEKAGSIPAGFCNAMSFGSKGPPLPVCFRAQKGNSVESANRKLIRPSFNDIKEKIDPPRKAPAGGPQKRPVPPDQTNAENFYYVKQMQSKTPMVITLKDGEVLRGVIEWYDRSCLKVNRDGEPNLLLYKSNIKYMHKEEEG
jgi:sRNA-binding regulator protein Hfq